MQNAYQKQHAAQIDKILSHASGETREFVRQFYAKMPVADVERMDPKYAAALAVSAYAFMGARAPGEPKIRIFTPVKREHGYDSRHTVIEVLNDDMPFLVDSLSAELARHGLLIRETLHPIVKISRDTQGRLHASGDLKAESFIHFEVSPLPETLTAEQLEGDLAWVLSHIRASVEDWRAIVEKAKIRIEKLDRFKELFDKETVAEVKDFLRWLIDRNFIFLGYAEYAFFDAKGKESLSVMPDSRLGILKITDEVAPSGLDALPPPLRHFLLVPHLIQITKSNRRSPVHRPVPMDYIGLKRFDAKGNVIGEARFLGLFTSNVYYQSAEMIPLARKKLEAVMRRADFDPVSHDEKSLKAILEFMPRDEIFQMSEDDLFETSMGILALEARPGVRIFARKDAFERFVSLMVFVPREQFSTELRYQIQALVEKAFNGVTSSFATQITEAPLTRLHLIVKTTPGDIPHADIDALEREIAKRAYLWSDLLQEALLEKHNGPKGEKLHRAYVSAFPQSYINRYGAEQAVHDIGKIEDALESGGLALELFRRKSEASTFVHLKIFNPHEEIALSDILPVLENAGFRAMEEHPFLITLSGGRHVWIRDFKLQPMGGAAVPFDQAKPLVEEAILQVWRGDMESDRFNTLVLLAGLSWRQVAALRAYAKYLKQAGFTASQAAIESAFAQHPRIAANIAALFAARFDPEAKQRDAKMPQIAKTIDDQLAQVSNAAQDHILRRYVELIMATLRTNYFQTADESVAKPVLSFKFDSASVPDLPLPRPYAEIFVYSPRIEGIHLRGGKVARGGLRWSDRAEDFRTEVLGLMKAQMVKNSVIVPVGSKGGFVVKRPPAARDAYLEEGVACYKLYLSGLLDITDNIVKGKVTPPPQVVRHDGDDPYLVVAADKGTATFSDIANGVSEQYGFWLGDAFASGGSAGYDHKKMAITARGGWVSVTRHFREMGVDIAKQDFTVAGIGDMAGDVFGNGMLLSKRIRLLAAFNHLHIFIDPNPDPAASFKERKRLFDLPRSTWKDYNAELISKGGGIFERSAKTIEVSKEAQAALGLSKGKYAPDDLIRAILLSPVDLLWNGGIGTYVKAEEETHEQVGDRANNAVRVNGKELRCKVVGEGGNLGFTQKGRIEYARAGGRLNTDAIDNSAGVDCSDHEVNIKIAFSHDVASGKLPIAKRNKILAAMTDEVADLVLKDNILQTQAITVSEQQGTRLLEPQARLMAALEKQGLLHRAIEFLPSDKQLAELQAAKKALTRPELAVLLAYSKMSLYKELLESDLPDEAYFIDDLKRYFPKAMRDEFEDSIARHRLKREIIATVMTNSLVNRAGITFCHYMTEDQGVPARDVAAAYSIVRDAFGLRTLWNSIEETAGGVEVGIQVEMISLIHRLLTRATVWMLKNRKLPLNVAAVSKELAPAIAELEKNKASLHSETTRKHAEALQKHLVEQGVPEKLAEKIAGLELMASALDIITIAQKTKLAAGQVGKTYFEIGERLGLNWLRNAAEQAAAASYWDRVATQSLAADLYAEQRNLTIAVLKEEGGLDAWIAGNQVALARLDHFVADLKASGEPDLPKLIIALKHVRGL